MPVRLNTIPDAEPYPVPPARIKWLTALLLMLSVGVALTSLFASDELAKNGPYFWGLACGAKWHLNRSQFGIRIDHDLASISDHSLASQSITIWHASDH